MKTYATYVKGEAREKPAHGVLTIDRDGVRFESEPVKSSMEALFPKLAREPEAPIRWFYPRAEIAGLTDLHGNTTEPPGFFGRVLRALHVEPNGLIITTAKRRVVFDCADSVYRLIADYGATIAAE